MRAGDMIRVEASWPGTRGRRLRVVEIEDNPQETVHAIDQDGKHRWIPKRHCHVDRRRTRSEQEER